MDDIDKAMDEYRKERELERQQFLKKGADKVKDNVKVIYQSLSLYIANRYGVYDSYQLPYVVYIILNHYFENVEEDFEEWLNKENSPLIRRGDEIPKIFPEIAEITENKRKIVEIANTIYGLNLKYYKEPYEVPYLYAFEFDFNSFIPIDIKKIKELKTEINVLKKYDKDTSELEEELKGFGLTEEQLNLL